MDKAIIFDMDGVLVESSIAHYHAWREVAAKRGLDLSFDAYRVTQGMDTPATVVAVFGELPPAEAAAIGEEKEKAFRDAFANDFAPIPGASELVATLHAAGWPMALATSAMQENADFVMNLMPGGEYLKVRVNSSLVKRAKPAPDLFLRAASLLGVEPGRCIVVEDSLAGLTAARAAGMAALGLTTTMSREELEPLADKVVDNLVGVTPEFLLGLLEGKR